MTPELLSQINQIVRDQVVVIGPVLLGDTFTDEQLTTLAVQLQRGLASQLTHTLLTYPLLPEARKTHALSLRYFLARTNHLISHLVGCYGPWALPLLCERRFGLLATLAEVHRRAGLLTMNQGQALVSGYAEILCLRRAATRTAANTNRLSRFNTDLCIDTGLVAAQAFRLNNESDRQA